MQIPRTPSSPESGFKEEPGTLLVGPFQAFLVQVRSAQWGEACVELHGAARPPAACSGLPLPPPGAVVLSIGILKGSPALLRAVSGGVALHVPVSIHPTSQAFLSTCHTGMPGLQTPQVMTWCLWEDAGLPVWCEAHPRAATGGEKPSTRLPCWSLGRASVSHAAFKDRSC